MTKLNNIVEAIGGAYEDLRVDYDPPAMYLIAGSSRPMPVTTTCSAQSCGHTPASTRSCSSNSPTGSIHA